MRIAWMGWIAAAVVAAVLAWAVVWVLCGGVFWLEYGLGMCLAGANGVAGIALNRAALRGGRGFFVWGIGGHLLRLVLTVGILAVVRWLGPWEFLPFGVSVAVGWLVFMTQDVIQLYRAAVAAP